MCIHTNYLLVPVQSLLSSRVYSQGNFLFLLGNNLYDKDYAKLNAFFSNSG